MIDPHIPGPLFVQQGVFQVLWNLWEEPLPRPAAGPRAPAAVHGGGGDQEGVARATRSDKEGLARRTMRRGQEGVARA